MRRWASRRSDSRKMRKIDQGRGEWMSRLSQGRLSSLSIWSQDHYDQVPSSKPSWPSEHVSNYYSYQIQSYGHWAPCPPPSTPRGEGNPSPRVPRTPLCTNECKREREESPTRDLMNMPLCNISRTRCAPLRHQCQPTLDPFSLFEHGRLHFVIPSMILFAFFGSILLREWVIPP